MFYVAALTTSCTFPFVETHDCTWLICYKDLNASKIIIIIIVIISDQLINKYKDMPKRSLKVSLKFLKQSQASPNEIRYVSRLLRNTIRTSADVPLSEFNHDIRIQNNFWNYVKSKLDSSTSSSPSFSMSACTNFFHDFFRVRHPLKCFKIPSWIPSLPQPSVPYNMSPPTYQQITKVVRRMKASGSPCPLDKI